MSYYYNPDDNPDNIPLENRPVHRSTNSRHYYNDDGENPFDSPLPAPPPPPPRDPPELYRLKNDNGSGSFHFTDNNYEVNRDRNGSTGVSNNIQHFNPDIKRSNTTASTITTSPDAPPPPPKDQRYSRLSTRISRESIIPPDDDYAGMGVLGASISRANTSNDLIFDYDERNINKSFRGGGMVEGFDGPPNTFDNNYMYDYDPNKPPPPPPRDDDYYDYSRNRRFSRYRSENYSQSMPPPPPPPPLPPIPYEDDEEDYYERNRALHNRSNSSAGLMNRTNVNQRIKKINWIKLPWFCWIVSIIQVSIFIAELVRMGMLTGSPIQTQPSFNPMVGPSSYIMINMGSRFTPCMHFIPNVTDASDLLFPCPNSTTTDTNVCSLSELCGFGGLPPPPKPPHQWWRFITPIFLHAGFVHIGFNLLLQLKLGAELEKEIGIIRFFIVYFASGIAGFVLGGNFTPDGISSTGASGALFGVIAIDLLDLLFNWQLYASPKRNLAIHIGEIVVSFVLGLLPGLDNFSHIGGFAMGILTGTAILRSPLKIRLSSRYSANPQEGAKLRASSFDWKNPRDHFRDRSRSWYLWVLLRIACIVLALVYFITLIKQFENGGGHCSWCKYLSCLPVHGWCDNGNITT